MRVATNELVRRVGLGFGDEQLLSRLMDDPTAQVIVIVGAEAFDAKGRVIQTGALYDRMQTMKKLLDRHRVHFVVVAEGFKAHEDLLSVPGFYRDHLDRIAVYPAGEFDLILSDSLVTQIQTAPKSDTVGQILCELGLLEEEKLKTALETQEKQRQLIGEVLVQLGFCTERDVLSALNNQRIRN